MLPIDLTGKRAFIAGVADDGGFGFAIAKAMAEAGASICVGTWPPAMNIFLNLLERGKMDASLTLSDGRKMAFEKIYPLDAAFDTLADAPADIRGQQALQGAGRLQHRGSRVTACGRISATSRSTSWSTAWPTAPRSRSR